MAVPQYKAVDIPVFTVCPNWSDGVSLRTQYDTLIREALDTTEERQGRRPRCLYGLHYSTLSLTAQETGYIRGVVERAQAMPVGMPVWTDPAKILVDSESGATELTVDDISYTLFQVLTDYVMIWNDFETWEVLAIESMAADTIVLSEPTTQDWPTGTMVFPILFGKLPRATTRQLTDAHGVFHVDFEERFNGLTDQSETEDFLPALAISYPEAGCREEFTLTFTGLAEHTAYSLDASQTRAGDYEPLIYFALDTDAEKASGEKTVTVNNIYNQPTDDPTWFRAAVMASATETVGPISRPIRPRESEIPPPVVTLVGEALVIDMVEYPNPSPLLEDSDIPSVEAGSVPDNPLNYNLNPLSFYKRGDGDWVIPLSSLEIPYLYDTDVYCQVSNKYAIKHWDAVSIGNLNARLPYPTEHQHEVVMTGSGDGAEYRFTRDRTDPTIDTIMEARNGLVNNADITDNAFAGVIKCRAFVGECRSPLVTVIVDKIRHELPSISVFYRSGSAAAGCDLTNGAGDESGNSCADLYGGPDGLDGELKLGVISAMEDTGVDLVETQDSPVLLNYVSIFSTDHLDYLGWVEHAVFVSGLRGELSWNRSSLWEHLPQAYSRVSLKIKVNDDTEIPYCYPEIAPQTFAGASGPLESINDSANAPLDSLRGSPPDIQLELTQWDITMSALPHIDPRLIYWAPILIDIAGADISEPAPAAPYVPSVEVKDETANDNFESYQDGTMIGATLDHDPAVGNPVFNGQWYVTAYEFNSAREDWESYTTGDMAALIHVGYVLQVQSFSGGEGWDPGSVWSVGSYQTKSDNFELYSVGSANFLAQYTGQGFTGAWIGARNVIGNEDFEGFTVGSFTSATPNPTVVGLIGTWVVS